MQQQKRKYRLENLAVVLMLSFLVLLIACRHDTTRRISPKAVKGVLDLTDWNFKTDGPVDLIGEYEFYWNRHLSPSDFSKASPPVKTGFIKLPGYWKDYEINGAKQPGDGYATYRLNLLLGEKGQPLAIRIVEISITGLFYTIYLIVFPVPG